MKKAEEHQVSSAQLGPLTQTLEGKGITARAQLSFGFPVWLIGSIAVLRPREEVKSKQFFDFSYLEWSRVLGLLSVGYQICGICFGLVGVGRWAMFLRRQFETR